MEARNNKKFDRIITVSNEEKCKLLGALNNLFMLDEYYSLSEDDRRKISELYNMLNF